MTEEYIDVLDENGNKTGEKKLKAVVHRDGDWHKGVHVWILNSKGELLIQKRSGKVQNHPNLWTMACTGHASAGENSQTTAARELREELGVQVEGDSIQFLFNFKNQYVLNNGLYINNEIDDVYLIHQDLDLSSLKIDADEVSNLKFIDQKVLRNTIYTKEFVPHPEEYKKLFEYLEKIEV